MSAVQVNFMDFDNLESYDELLKTYISAEDAKSFKKILVSSNGKSIYFFKDEDATVSDTPDFILSAYAPYVDGTTLVL